MRGCPRTFKNGDEFVKAIKSYVEYCTENNRLPNVAGFSAYWSINTDTFYAQKDYYPEEYKLVQTILEDEALNNHSVTDSMKVFYMKNKCGYKDRQEISAEVSSDISINIEFTDDE